MIVNFREKTIDDEEAYELVLKRNRFKELILAHMKELEIERFELLYYKDKHKRTAFYLAGEQHLYSKLLNFYQNIAILLESNRYDWDVDNLKEKFVIYFWDFEDKDKYEHFIYMNYINPFTRNRSEKI